MTAATAHLGNVPTQPHLKKLLEVTGRLSHRFCTRKTLLPLRATSAFAKGWGNSKKFDLNTRRKQRLKDMTAPCSQLFLLLNSGRKKERYQGIPPFISNKSRFWTHLGGLSRTLVCCPMQIMLPQFPYQQHEDVIMMVCLLGALWTVISGFISSSKMKCVT